MMATDPYRRCEEITRARAANFYYGIRLLPVPKRRALCAIYAFARRVDDIGDGLLTAAEQLHLLEQARADLGRVSSSTDPVLSALGDAAARFPIPLSAFADLIDGVAMDARGERFATFDALEPYCRRVAGSIGRLSVAVFGSSRPDTATRLADDLGVAMQLTNVLRDVREDLGRGRMYIPEEDLDRFGCGSDLGMAPPAAVGALVRFEAARARDWFRRGLRLLPLLDSRSGSCVAAMTGIYRRILARVERHPEGVLEGRVSLPPWEKAWVAARSLVGVGT
jgi:15-cis-phytoene synthase